MQPFKWLRERQARKIEAVAIELLRQARDEGEIWLFLTQTSKWQDMAISRGWLRQADGYVRKQHKDAAPYVLTDAGRAALLKAEAK